MAGQCNEEQRIIYVAKVFQAVQSALADLQDWRASFTTVDATKAARSLPNPASTEDLLPQLTFVDRLDYPGRDEDPGTMSRSLFTARLAGLEPEAFVKFCFRYGTRVYRLLASFGLAPKLYHCVSLVGGVTMVVPWNGAGEASE
ncbi:hypothetical protein K474DRAFT_1773178 [Panus rudis PR-1116 ss-1]|nr:hypothetical protein K474DRAFT_1773178 [Panus rudis PR-1116 ss-1]